MMLDALALTYAAAADASAYAAAAHDSYPPGVRARADALFDG
jgi:hypothetical protein